MNPIVKNVLAVLIGLVIGSIVNMGIIMISIYLIPQPSGADLTTSEGLKNTMHLMQPKHFLSPFLAHALGTLIGAFATAKLAISHKGNLALIIGALFLLGGIMNVIQLPSPIWFVILDLGIAYFPMAILGYQFAKK